MRPGCCRRKAHKPSHLGYGGRRVLVSRKWTAKDLADHRHNRRAHVLAVLGRTPDGHPAAAPGESSANSGPEPTDAPGEGFVWELAKNSDPDVDTRQRRVLRSIAHAVRWRTEYRTARDGHPPTDTPTDPASAADPAHTAA